MKKIEVLAWGVKHIAANYKMGANVDYEDDGEVCIYVTDKHPDVSPAPINDVQMLCDDLGIDREQIEVSQYGIDVYLDYAWVHTKEECEGYCDTDEAGILLEEYVPTGTEMWHTYGVEIGSPIEASTRETAETAPAVEPVACSGDGYVDLPF